MKKSTKGFTLIELLAVIVILAIIALIATPIVLNLINTARKGAAARSAEGIREAFGKYYFSNIVEHPEATITTFGITFDGNDQKIEEWSTTTEEIKLSTIIGGKLPTAGTVTVSDDGKVTATDLKIDGYTCSFGATGTAKCEKGSTTSGS